MPHVMQRAMQERGLPQTLQLAPHVCCCETATGIIFLDLNRNRYLGLGAEESRLFAALMRTAQQATPPLGPLDSAALQSLAQQLEQHGLITHDAATRQRFQTTRVRLDGRLYSVGQELDPVQPLRALHLVNFARAYAWAKLALRRGPLLPIASHLYAEKRRLAAPDSADSCEQLVALVAAFRRIRPYVFAAREQCLLHALTLTKFLLLCGARCTWVVGVRTKPWAAHSWAQHENLILDTTPERVVEYTPILCI